MGEGIKASIVVERKRGTKGFVTRFLPSAAFPDYRPRAVARGLREVAGRLCLYRHDELVRVVVDYRVVGICALGRDRTDTRSQEMRARDHAVSSRSFA